MASANRLMDVRHGWCSRSRMAEINVPAWPMPIHHTKLRMSKPQPTGTLGPHTPMPRKRRLTMANSRSWSSPKETAKPTHQPHGVRR